MFPKKEPLVELKSLRTSRDSENVKAGGSSGLPMQQLFIRFYRKGIELFRLERDNTPMTGEDHAVFRLWKLFDTPRIIKMDGQEQWGNGFSWADAERAIMDLLGAACIQRDHEVEKLELALVSGK